MISGGVLQITHHSREEEERMGARALFFFLFQSQTALYPSTLLPFAFFGGVDLISSCFLEDLLQHRAHGPRDVSSLFTDHGVLIFGSYDWLSSA
jgi:hypothetical protein